MLRRPTHHHKVVHPESRLEVSEHERALVPAVVRALERTGVTPSSPLTDETVARFLRARNAHPEQAASMLATALRTPPAPAPCPRCLENPRAHSFYPIGPTSRGEPVTYSNYLAANVDPVDNMHHMRYAMDSLFDDGSLHRMTWVMDMHGFGRKHLSPTVARRVLTLFADNYPERLGRAIVYDAPSIFYGLFSAVKVFADPTTVQKVVFVKHDKSARRNQFEQVGIVGECLEKLLVEIDEARDPDVIKSKNWWAVQPLPPMPHYGEPFAGPLMK